MRQSRLPGMPQRSLADLETAKPMRRSGKAAINQNAANLITGAAYDVGRKKEQADAEN